MDEKGKMLNMESAMRLLFILLAEQIVIPEEIDEGIRRQLDLLYDKLYT